MLWREWTHDGLELEHHIRGVDSNNEDSGLVVSLVPELCFDSLICRLTLVAAICFLMRLYAQLFFQLLFIDSLSACYLRALFDFNLFRLGIRIIFLDEDLWLVWWTIVCHAFVWRLI